MVIDLLTFRLADGVDDGTFRRADRDVQQRFGPRHPGFVRRTTARGADGGWLVVTLWSSDAEADANLAAAGDHPAAVAFDALLDPSSVQRRRYTTLD